MASVNSKTDPLSNMMFTGQKTDQNGRDGGKDVSDFDKEVKNLYAVESSADKLRQRVYKMRKSNKNPWKGSTSSMSTNSNNRHPERALIRGNMRE